jgi:type I restriction enzyme, S subunit
MADQAQLDDGLAEVRVYLPGPCAPFRRLTDPLGDLSNMAPGFSLRVGGVEVGSSEALYQCMRFPHRPDVQAAILAARAPVQAKEAGAPWREETRRDWEHVRVAVMRWCLRVKRAQHRGRIAAVLAASDGREIVEVSVHDAFWGAQPRPDGAFVGANVLGRLWTELRDEPDGTPDEPVAVEGCRLLGTVIESREL